jgi:hypothetical protein
MLLSLLSAQPIFGKKFKRCLHVMNINNYCNTMFTYHLKVNNAEKSVRRYTKIQFGGRIDNKFTLFNFLDYRECRIRNKMHSCLNIRICICK